MDIDCEGGSNSSLLPLQLLVMNIQSSLHTPYMVPDLAPLKRATNSRRQHVVWEILNHTAKENTACMNLCYTNYKLSEKNKNASAIVKLN